MLPRTSWNYDRRSSHGATRATHAGCVPGSLYVDERLFGVSWSPWLDEPRIFTLEIRPTGSFAFVTCVVSENFFGTFPHSLIQVISILDYLCRILCYLRLLDTWHCRQTLTEINRNEDFKQEQSILWDRIRNEDICEIQDILEWATVRRRA